MHPLVHAARVRIRYDARSTAATRATEVAMRYRFGLLLIAFVMVPASIAGAQPPPGPPPGAPQAQMPPRDRPPAQTATAVIRGRIVASDTGKPLGRARISANAPELGGETRSTSTSVEGRYELKDLPAGRYTIRVTRSGYLPLQYGQRRPLEQGKPLQVADKQSMDNVDFVLVRAGVIRGQITDELNEPVADVPVFAMRSMYWQGRRRTVPAGPPGRTDDAGEYRLVGIAPGTYYVMANLRETWTITEDGVQHTLGYAPTYYPGTASVTEARRVSVAVGQDAVNTNFSLIAGRAADVSGVAVDSLGRPLASRPVTLLQEMAGPQGGVMMMGGTATTAADGTFVIRNVNPGQYRLRTQALLETKTPPVQEIATLPITVDGVDIRDVSLTTSAGWSMSGRVVTESGAAPDGPRDRFRLAARVVDVDSSPIPGAGLPPPPPGGGPTIPDSGRVHEDWTFVVTNAFGQSRLTTSLPDGWSLKSIVLDGRDITDTPVEAKSGEELSAIQVIVTSRVTTVAGQLVDDKGAPVVDGTVLLFADDASKWWEETRWVRAVRPDQQGRYEIKGLPPGEYLAVALNYIEEGMWNDPDYLESIRRYGQKLTLIEGDSQTPALKVITP
jgi:carboxypeptidase family protein